MISHVQQLRGLHAESSGKRFEYDGMRFRAADGLGVETQLEVIADPDAAHARVAIRKRREPKPRAESLEGRWHV